MSSAPLSRALERLDGVRRSGTGYQAKCPVADAHTHGDRKPSLSISEAEDGRVLLKCHTGCTTGAVLAAMELSMADLHPERADGCGPIVDTYRYVDEGGDLLFEVVRFAPKRFVQRRPDGAGGWEWKLGDTRRVLYRLPRVLETARKGAGVFVVEGEKDVHALERLGLIATCNPGGAGKWRSEYAEALRGAQVVVVADRDDAGREHAREVAASLEGVADDVEIVEPAAGSDVADHLAAGLRLGQLKAVDPSSRQAEAAPELTKLRRLDVARMAREEPPPIPWVVEDFVVRGALTALVARFGEGKSLLSAALAAGVASGTNEAGLVCRQGPVVIVDAENGQHEIHRRVRALGVPAAGIEVYEADVGFDLRWDLAQVEGLLERHAPALLVLDSFRSLWGGDENDSREVSAVLDPLRNLIRRYGAGTLLLHHAGKQGGYRGSSAIGSSVELAFTLARADEDPNRDRRYLECFKSRPAPNPQKRWLELVVERGQVYIDAAEPFEREPERPSHKTEALRPAIVRTLASGPRSLADVARAVGHDPKNRTIRRVLDSLAGEGAVTRDDGGLWRVSGVKPPKGDDTLTPDTLAANGRHGWTPERAEAEAERIQAKLELLDGGAS